MFKIVFFLFPFLPKHSPSQRLVTIYSVTKSNLGENFLAPFFLLACASNLSPRSLYAIEHGSNLSSVFSILNVSTFIYTIIISCLLTGLPACIPVLLFLFYVSQIFLKCKCNPVTYPFKNLCSLLPAGHTHTQWHDTLSNVLYKAHITDDTLSFTNFHPCHTAVRIYKYVLMCSQNMLTALRLLCPCIKSSSSWNALLLLSCPIPILS